MKFDKSYWSDRWANKETGWDLGMVSPPIKDYIDSQQDKSQRILIPGCGNAYEAEYLWSIGFDNTFVIDIAKEAVSNLKNKVPEKFHSQIICGDFFEHNSSYDLILEQTFFCTFPVLSRSRYVEKIYDLLNDKGILAGLLFAIPLYQDHPPFGGHKDDYIPLFRSFFDITTM